MGTRRHGRHGTRETRGDMGTWGHGGHGDMGHGDTGTLKNNLSSIPMPIPTLMI
ncbi:hypothetical protein F7734_59070 [Scytonema sp. UIC 10036]|uniref:hypothetical protein n=1 Tax=Scytonema sp. UIC 10036 TaxID=2304196 RepID=UPI0012DA7981|nr:hypothetical protein [Scytonema sp. UIC 10036]MUH01640.1 hypothetical protein [Scytonema sp. UIC 10036]